jgi:hypothetical protein
MLLIVLTGAKMRIEMCDFFNILALFSQVKTLKGIGWINSIRPAF